MATFGTPDFVAVNAATDAAADGIDAADGGGTKPGGGGGMDGGGVGGGGVLMWVLSGG